MANPSIQLGTNSNWAVKEDKLLAYKEYNDYFFNKEFDFSRGTSATYVAKDGLIKTAGIQPNIVNNGDFSELGSELITNGDFSDGSSNWVTEGGSSTWVIDNVANKISSSNFALYQNITRTVGKIYKISFDIVEYTSGTLSITLGNGASTSFNTAGSKTVYLEWDGSDDRIRFRSSFIGKIDNVSVKQVDPNDYWTLGTNWSFGDGRAVFDTTSNSSFVGNLNISSGKLYRVKIEGEVTSGNIKLSASSGLGNDQVIALPFQQDIIHDGGANTIEIRTIGAAEGFITNISVQEIQTDTPRIDFTNDTKGHLLLEPSRTNIITNSSNFAASSWATVSSILTSVNIDLPDGTTGGFKISQNGGSSYRMQDAIGLSSNNHFFSLFVKGTSHTSDFVFRIRSLRGEDAKFNINTNNEISYNSGLSTNYFIEEYQNGWYRVGFESTMSNTLTNYFQIYPDTTTNSFGSIYIWGAQVEEGSYATSYIPTTNATSTRNADVCNNSGSAQDFNSEEGVLYAEIQGLVENSPARVISIGEGLNFENGIIMSFDTSNNLIKYKVRSNNITTVDISKGGVDRTLNHKIAVKYKVNDFQIWLDGSKVASTTSGAVPLSLSKIQFSDMNVTGSPFYGKVRNVQVFTEALTDAELQELTS